MKAPKHLFNLVRLQALGHRNLSRWLGQNCQIQTRNRVANGTKLL
jgi:hypothetical protein